LLSLPHSFILLIIMSGLLIQLLRKRDDLIPKKSDWIKHGFYNLLFSI
jgi:hypothetical protein